MSKHQTMHVDVNDAGMLENLSINDGVTLTFRGKITAISAPRKNKFDDEPEIFPGDISIEVEKLKIVSGRNVFSELDEDGDESEE